MSAVHNPPNDVLAALRSPKLLRAEILGGLVVALALIPEAISFSVIANVDPRVGLFASVTMAITISFLGGRTAMISAATGAVALVVAPVALNHGVDYLIATVLLGGIIQIALGLAGVATLMRFVPRSVMVGFVNALAILLAWAQWDNLTNVPWEVYPIAIAAIGVIWLMPKVTSAVPAPLIAIVALTAIAWVWHLNVPTVSDQGELPTTLPPFGLPDIPWNLETLETIAPYAIGMALVGLMESLMTAKLVDDITDTRSNKQREALGQGAANLVTGLFGGMGGCAMIGQTMINVRQSGARTRISTFLSGVFLLIFLLVLGDVVGQIPMAALAGVMIMVAIGTFDWHSLRTLPKMPRSETIVMLSTVAVVLLTHNLLYGVGVGVVVAALLFARRVAHLASLERVIVERDGTQSAYYRVHGSLFFASSNDLYNQFDYVKDPARVVIDFSSAHVWDASTVAALDAVTTKYGRIGTTVEIVGLNPSSRAMYDRLSGRLG